MSHVSMKYDDKKSEMSRKETSFKGTHKKYLYFG